MISVTAIEIDIIMLLSLLQETLTLIGGLLIIYLIYIIFIRGRDKLPNNATHMAHIALRKLVDRTVDEVCKLLNSQNSPSNNTNDDQLDANNELTMSRRNHDDLFKMIIVNKVMEKSRFDQFNKNNNISNFQLLNGFPEIIPCSKTCSSTVEVRKSELISKCDEEACKFNRTYKSFIIEEKIEELASNSDEDFKDECDNCPNFYKFHRVPFPELGMDIIDPNQISQEGEDEIDDLEYTKVVSLVDSWKDNWLFRKKNFKQYSKFVSMFVPNTDTEYRAMIGDKDIDETSDLSEYLTNSDEDSEQELTLPVENESLHRISGYCDDNKIESNNCKLELNHTDKTENTIISNNRGSNCINEKTLMNCSSDVSTSIPEFYLINTSLKDPNMNDLKNEISATVNTLHSKKIEFLNEQSNNNILNQNTSITRDSNIPTDIINSSQINKVENQQDNNYTEQDIFVTERHDVDNTFENSFTKLKKFNREHNIGINSNIHDVDHHCLTYDNEYSEKEVQLNAPPKPGSIAEREHKKWESATSIKNNPYSKENIQKRFLEKKYIGPFDLSRFTRDCYIDNRIVSNIETKRSVVSDSLTKSISDINCNKSNQNECNLEIQENIKFIKPNLPIQSNKDLILTTNSEKHYNKPILNTTINETNEEVLQVVSDESTTLESTKNNKMLEHERRYNKNEIQVKLNNQDHILDGVNEVLQSDQPLCNEKWSIREMDLTACEFDKNDLPKLISNLNSIEQEGMNKLDTQPLNYLESSIVKNQSINEFDNQAYKGIGYKSNLINKKQIDTVDSIKIADIDGDFLLDNQTKTNVILEKDNSEVTSTIITPCKASVTCNSENIIENKLTKYETEIITAKLFNEKRDFYHGKSVEHFLSNGEISNNNNCIEKKLSMPSVKQLVQVFDKKYQETITSNLVAESKSDELERKGIKSIQSRRSISRQLHSLTARSLSKEFREGLRQIPNKTRMHNLKYKKILQ